jgi:hypothetical protein
LFDSGNGKSLEHWSVSLLNWVQICPNICPVYPSNSCSISITESCVQWGEGLSDASCETHSSNL